MAEKSSGFKEVEHTADWALQVWAPDLPLLFSLAAQGMYSLMETELDTEERVERQIVLQGEDHESLLVVFLSELLYLGESQGLGFDYFDITIDHSQLKANVTGAAILYQGKEIKAVTYHNLKILQASENFKVTIVFDV